MWKNFSFSDFNFSLVLFIFFGKGGGGGVMELFSDEDDEFISKSLHVPLSSANVSSSACAFEEPFGDELMLPLLLMLEESRGIAEEEDDMMVIILGVGNCRGCGDTDELLINVTLRFFGESTGLCWP